MNKALLAATVSLAIGLSSAAQAESYYVFGDYGRSDIDTGVPSTAGLTSDESDSALSLGVGFRYNENFSVELGYADLGEASFSTTAPLTETLAGNTVTLDGSLDLDAKGFFLGVRGDMDVADNIGLFARVGFLDWESDADFSGTVTVNGTAYTGTASAELADGTDPYLGVGVDYDFNENLAANLQYTRYFLDFEGADVDVDTFTLGLTYSF